MPAKNHAGTQGPEKRPGTQGCLRQEARPTSSGSDARWREEVMRREIAGGSDAGAFAPGS